MQAATAGRAQHRALAVRLLHTLAAAGAAAKVQALRQEQAERAAAEMARLTLAVH
jgi:hypothetical protein